MQWFTMLRKFEYIGEQRRGEGTTFFYEEHSSGQCLKLNFIVTEWIENKKLAFKLTSGSLKKDEQVWSIEATSSGSRFTMFEDLEMPMGIFGKLIGALFGQMMIGGSMNKILDNLKKLAEA